MCGRFSLTATPEQVQELFGLEEIDDFPPRYNIAPTQPILTIVGDVPRAPGDNRSGRRALLARWGFLPGWVKDPGDFPLLINARSESAIDKASFRAAMRHRRVLVAASGFYEWHRPGKETGRKSTAYWIRPADGGIVVFAGLMETYMSPDGAEIDTACILTVAANDAIASIHDRMPVVIGPEDFGCWLDCRGQEPHDVAGLMRAAPQDLFEAIRVSDLVNKVANTGPELQKPAPREPDEDVAAAAARKPAARKTEAGDPAQMKLF